MSADDEVDKEVAMVPMFENVLVAVQGMPEGSVVSLGVGTEGLVIGGYGTLAWAGAQVLIEERAPEGLRIRIGRTIGTPSIFFIPVESLAGPDSIAMMVSSLERMAADAGATVEGVMATAVT